MYIAMTLQEWDEWLHALESGIYQQGTGVLRRPGVDGEPDKFCCLGVYCVINRVDMEEWGRETGVNIAPPELDVIPADFRDRLASLNDLGHSFAEIAKFLRMARSTELIILSLTGN